MVPVTAPILSPCVEKEPLVAAAELWLSCFSPGAGEAEGKRARAASALAAHIVVTPALSPGPLSRGRERGANSQEWLVKQAGRQQAQAAGFL
ncbi:hypothetical protein CBM2623_B80087 [Cupriavidus taiwanensis]|nr:hypothetical protein CBM2608_B90088 [Cupriavidus taiwanensis]SPA36468.1 hypothetical protein CBM2623_B80087 [Cupriavidus taiwanensis]SPA53117.1 hypothetical protein CBM2629_B90130 [Cupriavidus taiwanensis]